MQDLAISLILLMMPTQSADPGDYLSRVQPLIAQYCVECHSGDTPNGDVDFEAIRTSEDVVENFASIERGIHHLQTGRMPPKDADQPTESERRLIESWLKQYVANVKSRPATFRPRRLSVNEYRNTLESVFGFGLRVAVIEAEQTLAERSLVMKLLPVDPPGESGFKNDTHRNPLTTVAWDQYSYLADTAIDKLFSKDGRDALETIVGEIDNSQLSEDQAAKLAETFLERTRRRPASEDLVANVTARLKQQSGNELQRTLRFELKAMLMSPVFLYRGMLLEPPRKGRQRIDPFELAERLSYFLWADMPDEELRSAAASGSLFDDDVLVRHIDRLLASPKSRSLADIFATEWLTLAEIQHTSNNPPVMLALQSQPVDFMNYLFTQDRPLLELIESDTAFINHHTARHYGHDSKQLKRPPRRKGIEVAAAPNQRIELRTVSNRGGILTMPGILAMNKGPIQRGTWMLERIMGEDLPEPPPDVGQVAPNRGGEKLTFRQRFEQHRSNDTCAVCHDKIDPLGFALQTYDVRGTFVKAKNYKPNRRDVRTGVLPASPESGIDTSGRLPTGETFRDVNELKQILQTSQRRVVLRNIVRRTLSYALCRKLMIYDRPTVESITDKMERNGGTWRGLFIAIATSIPFQETIHP